MLETIKSINDVINGLVWGVPAMVCIIGVGILLSVRTGFIQFRKFPYAMKATLGKIFKKSEAGQGSITPFQAVCTALAATVGTGNIAGVAGAIAIGGPCVQSLQKLHWRYISAKEMNMAIMLVDQCITLEMVCRRTGIFLQCSMRALQF